AVDDFLAPDRIVIGAVSSAAAQRVIQLYDRIRAPVVVCSRRSAELAKYAANGYLATRISFINEISTLCDLESADIADVAHIMELDRRIGAGYLNAGLGWGGSCFPKDVRALAALSRRWGCATGIFCAAVDINERQRQRVVRHLRDAVRGTEQPVVAVLGLAFKPETDDVRDSPALDVIGRLLDVGVRVRAHDP